MAIRPSPEEAEKRKKLQEDRHREELTLRPYMDHTLSGLIKIMIRSNEDSPEYKVVMNEIDYREREWNKREINPLTDII